MKNCIYEPVFGLFLLFNFQIDSTLTFSSRLSYEKMYLFYSSHNDLPTWNHMFIIMFE